jgi:chromosome segregation ATPase
MSAIAETLGRRAADQVETIALLRGEVDELRAELAIAIDANTTARIERDGLGRSLARRTYELAALRAELESLERSLTGALSRLSGAETARATLREELEAAQGQNDQLTARLAEALGQVEQREEELDEIERSGTRRAAEDAGAARALRWQLAMLEHERAAELRRSRAETSERDQRIEHLDGQIQELEGQIATIDGRLERATEERDRSVDALHDRDQSIEALHDQLREETAIAESLTAQLDRVERRLAVRATQLQAIRQSRSFRIALRAAHIKDTVLHPRRSRQRRRASQAAGDTEAETE